MAYNVRQQAVSVLQPILRRKSSLQILKQRAHCPELQEICYGVCRYYYQLDFIAKQLLRKVPQDDSIYLLIIIGLYQLLYMNTAPYAVISEAVEASKVMNKAWASKLINAVLRNFQRQQDTLFAQLTKKPDIQYAHPGWLTDAIKHAYPEDWRAILQANNQKPPMTLRVNQQKITRQDYQKKLHSQAIASQITRRSGVGITLANPIGVKQLPSFYDGEVSLQDEAAQLAADLLDVHEGMRVLDACAAPGGKTCHLLEQYPSIDLTAIDNQATRLQQIQENLQRLQLQAKLITADAANTNHWWDKQTFDRILLDAPCSATGVIRRHPDSKLLKRKSDIAALADKQLTLLTALWPLLKPGGKLLYATCSILPQENQQVIEKFLRQQAAQVLYQEQLLPDANDGFFYTLLTTAIN